MKKSKPLPLSWVNPKLYINNSKINGKGVFTNTHISKGELLSIFGGHIVSLKDHDKLPSFVKNEGVQISENFVLTATNQSEIEVASFFNHSCDPNTGYKGQICLVSIKFIKIGDEVTFDYGMELYENVDVGNHFEMNCSCGSKKCRKVITSNDWKIPKLQEKYDGFFQWFIQEKINKLKNKK